MKLLTDVQLREITEAIQDRHLAFVVSIVGVDKVSAKDLARLKRKGLIGTSLNLPKRAYEFGMLSASLGAEETENLPFPEMIRRVSEVGTEPTSEERYAVDALKRSLFTHIKGLGNTMDEKTHRVLIESDNHLRRRLQARIKRELVQGIEQRRTVREVAASLAKIAHDQERDWHRIAATEIHNAYVEGHVQAVQARNKGKDPLVFKRPRPDGCPECKKHYLEKDGVTPKVFALSELVANGTTNEGRRLSQWKPTLGCLHPWCMCSFHELPPGFGFDTTGKMIYQGV